MNPIWKQVIGITKALRKIIHFTDPEDPGMEFFGYHLDLKPENILVDRAVSTATYVLKITDFGQTKFVDPAIAGTSHVTSPGGTDAYAPPEFLGSKPDRVYDIWSLGIIVLEILAYAIWGVDGLLHPQRGLDNVRHTGEGTYQTNSRFYTGMGENAELKPQISNWITLLLQDPKMKDNGNYRFVEGLLDIIIRMLEPEAKRRITIEEVVRKMAEVFGIKASEVSEVTTESLKKVDEVVLVDLRYI
jgi:serine/threonine protein kinase